MGTTITSKAYPQVECGLAALVDHLRIARSHFAGPGTGDLPGLSRRIGPA